jgi:PPOX class probable F420-dependent enzyme
MDRGEAIARLRSARVGRLATVTADARPHVVPFVFAIVDASGNPRAYWAVDRKPKRSGRVQRLRNIERHPEVEVVVDGYDEDWRALWWVRASGTGRVVDDASHERAAALDALASKYRQYASEPPPGPVVAIDIDQISGWRAEPQPGLEDRP